MAVEWSDLERWALRDGFATEAELLAARGKDGLPSRAVAMANVISPSHGLSARGRAQLRTLREPEPVATGPGIAARFPGHCPRCQGSVAVGERITRGDDGKYRHITCQPVQAA